MVKSKERVAEKMARNVRTGGTELKASMEDAIDPLDVLAADPEKFAKRLQDGLSESVRTGKYAQGIKKAKERNSWKGAIDKAARHYEESADIMVEHAMEDYDARGGAIERAKARIKDMPSATRAQRIQKSAKYQEAVGEEFDKMYGRKT